MRVCVIGGAGRMGSWFARYFKGLGHEVSILDLDEKRASVTSIEIGADIVRSVTESWADAYVVCVPVSAVADVIYELVGEAPNRRAALVEISSVKSPLLNALRDALKSGFHVVSMHPIFGPGTSDPSKGVTVLISLVGDGSETILARSLMPNFNFLVMSAEEHDYLTSFFLSLTHFLNMSFCLSLADDELGRIKGIAGSSFEIQLEALSHVLDGGDVAIAETLILNPNSLVVAERLLHNSSKLFSLIKNKDVSGLTKEISKCREILNSIRDH